MPLPGKSFTDLHIPPTVQGVLAARIDRLPPEEKALLQTLAVIGKEFPLSLLKQVVGESEDTLLQLVSRLQAAEFIYEQPAFPEPEYTFKHALTQEVAYNSVLIERRKVLHEHTAQAIETLFRSRLEDYYSELAHHYTRSGNTEKAVEYLQLAGQQAVQRSAYAEASSHFTTALELLQTLPDTPEHIQQELTLQTALGPVLIATKGEAAPEIGKAYARALELCQRLGETSQLFPVVMGLCVFSTVRGEWRKGRELAEQGLRLAQRVQDPALLAEAHTSMGNSLYWMGEWATARPHLEQALALYDPQQHRAHAFMYGSDPGVFAGGFLSSTLWMLGYPDQALQRSQATLALARELSQTNSLASALILAAFFHALRREWPAAQGRAEEVVALATEQGLLQWLALGTFFQGWALAGQGQHEAGIALIRQGNAAVQTAGAQGAWSVHLGGLADACGQAGQVEEGLRALDEAFAVARALAYEAELWRLKGELTLQLETRGWGLETSPSSPQASSLKPQVSKEAAREAEECFHKAIEIARRQQAKSLELRATMSLARLWQQQGKKAEARQMLAEIYGWFTEGFDTADLREAKTLLESLS